MKTPYFLFLRFENRKQFLVVKHVYILFILENKKNILNSQTGSNYTFEELKILYENCKNYIIKKCYNDIKV